MEKYDWFPSLSYYKYLQALQFSNKRDFSWIMEGVIWFLRTMPFCYLGENKKRDDISKPPIIVVPTEALYFFRNIGCMKRTKFKLIEITPENDPRIIIPSHVL